MQTITVTFDSAKNNPPIELGHRGENLATTIQFDISAWVEAYGDGSVVLLNQRKNETNYPYPVVVEKEENIVTWNVTNVDTGIAGTGWCELQYYVGDVLAKSDKWRTITKEALGETVDVPEPWEGFLDEVTSLTARSETAATNAEQSASAAADSLDKLPYPDAQTRTWWIWDNTINDYVDSGVETGGEGGTDNYNDLINQPQINGNTLTGNQTGATLGLVDAVPGKGLSSNDYSDADKLQLGQNTGAIAENANAIAQIEDVIPPQASSNNQLADKQFVNSSIQTSTAHYRGSWATWAAVPTDASLYPQDDGGVTTPTSNDYLVVQDAADYPVETGADALVGTWRFKYSGLWTTNGKSGWHPEYQVNEEPLTAAQIAAINSGITAAGVAQIGANQTAISGIKDGASINSFAGVETALLGKVNTADYNPAAKTASMTQEVGKDSSGRLWTTPAAQDNVVTVSGTTPVIVAEANTRYICGEVSTLSFTPPAIGICDVVFTSGTTATVLTVPSTVRWANDFDPTSLEANTTYEINIMDGIGVAVGVSA